MVDLVRGVDRGYFDAGVARTARTVGGINDAPSDGNVYARQDGLWVIISDGNEIPILPATATPLANAGVGGVGSSSKYAREDHFHPAIGITDVTNLETTLNNIIATGGGQVPIQFKDEGVNLGTAGTIDQIDFVGDSILADLTGTSILLSVNASLLIPPYLIQNAGVL